MIEATLECLAENILNDSTQSEAVHSFYDYISKLEDDVPGEPFEAAMGFALKAVEAADTTGDPEVIKVNILMALFKVGGVRIGFDD